MNVTQRNEILAKALASGSSEARNEMIIINRPLVLTTVRRFLHANPSCRQSKDDLFGVGLVALVRAVDRLAKVIDPDRPVKNYLITAIRSKLATEMRRQRAYYGCHYHMPTYDSLPEATLAAEDKSLARVDQVEFLRSLCESDLDRTVLEFYLYRASRAEIAALTGRSKRSLYLFFKKLRSKAQILWQD